MPPPNEGDILLINKSVIIFVLFQSQGSKFFLETFVPKSIHQVDFGRILESSWNTKPKHFA